ncbi:MAG TPA: DUF4239 domain-containing protein [Candidatus Acidoferrum sp.]|nr:DUF4239 domain-containing protein [Candidatus Acidoferrum sp.]
MTALYAVPSLLLLIVAMAFAAAIACAGLIVVHVRFSRLNFGDHNAVAGPMLGIVGGIFAVMLAFVTVVVWEEYDGSQQRLAIEGSAAGDIWRSAAGLPPGEMQALRDQIVAFAHTLIKDEWPQMQRGSSSARAEEQLDGLFGYAARIRPANFGEANTQGTILQAISRLHDARRHRLLDNESGVSSFQWTVLLIGAIAVFAYCYLMGIDNLRAHAIMIGALAVVVSSMFVLIFELDYPFRGDLAITPSPWVDFLNNVTSMRRPETAAPRKAAERPGRRALLGGSSSRGASSD